jgi:excisionase family DNA binding protein
MREKLLTTREVSQLLNISEKDIIDLAHAGILPHLKVAGEFLRFKHEDIMHVKEKVKKRYNLPEKKSKSHESFREFLYFNDFYVISGVLVVALLVLIIKDVLY